MTSKAEPCHVEPCKPATGSCNLFWTQLAASVDLSILVLYEHITTVRRQFAQHYSGSVVAETLSIHWYHTEGCCNDPSGMSLPNLSFFSVVDLSGYFRILLMEYSWHLLFWQILFIWSLRQQVESNKTPRFLGGSVLGAMGESPMLMTMSSWRLVVSLVVIIISSVLSSFNFNKFLAIHVLMSLMQASTCDMAVCLDIDSHGLNDIYSCVSSAQRWKSRLWLWMILPSGVVYMVNRIGPSPDPCGTPYFSVTGSDVLVPIWTVWVLSWIYDLSHLRAFPLIPNE